MSSSRNLLIIIASTALLAGCAGGQQAQSPGSGTLPASSADAKVSTESTKGFPVTIENCGRKVTVPQAPQHIVSLNQGTTEMLLSLGLADRMAGTATWTDPVLPNLAASNATVKRLSENNPSFESVIAEQPDLVTASFANTMAAGGVAPYEKFAELSIPAYMSHVECLKAESGVGKADGKRAKPIEMEDIYTDITDLATLTGTQDRGAELVSALTKRLNAVKPAKGGRPITVVFWFANSEAPYVAGGLGAPGIISRHLGLTNVYDDRSDEWPQVSWEDIAAKNPDVVIMGDLTRKSQTAESGAAKLDFLTKNPVTRQMNAVKGHKIILVAGGDMNPSIRTVDGVEKVSAGLTALGLR